MDATAEVDVVGFASSSVSATALALSESKTDVGLVSPRNCTGEGHSTCEQRQSQEAEETALAAEDSVLVSGHRVPAARISQSDSSLDSRNISSQEPTSVVELSYFQNIEKLAQCLPHLRRLKLAMDHTHCRFRWYGAIHCLDYHEGLRYPQQHPKLTSEAWEDDSVSDEFRALSVMQDPTVVTRVILIEDLSSSLISALGDACNLDPEFFAEHLNRSGYPWDSHNDKLPKAWDGASLRKPYASLPWYHPLRQSEKVIKGLSPQSDLMRTRNLQEVYHWTSSDCRKKCTKLIQTRTHHDVRLKSNIFRAHRAIATTEHDTGMTALAWKEKASYYLYSKASAPISKCGS